MPLATPPPRFGSGIESAEALDRRLSKAGALGKGEVCPKVDRLIETARRRGVPLNLGLTPGPLNSPEVAKRLSIILPSSSIV